QRAVRNQPLKKLSLRLGYRTIFWNSANEFWIHVLRRAPCSSHRNRFRRRKRHVPGVVAVEPSGVVVAALHPSIGAGNGLNARSAWLAVRFVAPEGARDIVALHFLEAARQNGRVLDGGRAALRHVRRHGVAG